MVLAGLISATLAAALTALASTAPAEPLIPARAAVPPVIDGDLGDAVWQHAPQLTAFKTWRPDFGDVMADQTVVFYAYDAENLYFAFRALDREPNRIKAAMSSRDSINSDDWICINLDSFGDQQSLYAFYVNPLGIQGDSRYASGREDFGFDAVWYSAGKLDPEGYSIEVRIPFKSLRYGGSNPVRMGVVFERSIPHRSEGGTYPALNPASGANFLIQTAPIDFTDINHYTLLEVLPDVTYSHQREMGIRSEGRGELGVTAKYGITSRLTVDGTVNPDFSQVEADAGQIDINLRSALFYSEKRPFFLEGSDLFTVGGPTTTDPLQAIVHTRTIDNPVAGARLTGKLARADTIAAIYAVDELPAERGGETDHAQVLITRYKRTLDQDSYVGGFFTGREQDAAYNRVAGIDGSHRLGPAAALGYHAFVSGTRGTQGPSAGGHALGAEYGYDSRKMSLSVATLDISTAFNAETGYLTRTGVSTLRASFTPRFFPRSSVLRRVEPTLATVQTRDAFAGLWEGSTSGALRLIFTRSSQVLVRVYRATEVFGDQEFSISGVTASAVSQVNPQFYVRLSVGRRDAIYYPQSLQGRSTSAVVTLVYQPADQMRSELDITYANFARDSDGLRLYDYGIVRSHNTFQVNRYLFFRGIVEYNSFRKQVLTDLLGSFTYIPGTVMHLGYGSMLERLRVEEGRYIPSDRFAETRRGFFFKASYLWRM